MVAQQRIVQIIEADGWLAVYDHGTGDVRDLRTKRLVCWALVEDGTGTRVIGMDAEYVAGKQESATFVGYAREGESLKKFEKRG